MNIRPFESTTRSGLMNELIQGNGIAEGKTDNIITAVIQWERLQEKGCRRVEKLFEREKYWGGIKEWKKKRRFNYGRRDVNVVVEILLWIIQLFTHRGRQCLALDHQGGTTRYLETGTIPRRTRAMMS